MSMKQVEAAKRLARSMCQSKSKVTDGTYHMIIARLAALLDKHKI